MAMQNQQHNQKKPHFILGANGQAEPFQALRTGGSRFILPPRDRYQHGRGLLNQLEGLHSRFEEARERQTEAGLEEGIGLQIEFESFPDIEIAFDSLGHL